MYINITQKHEKINKPANILNGKKKLPKTIHFSQSMCSKKNKYHNQT